MNENYRPRLYSINLAAYIIVETELYPKAKLDEDGRTYYFEFEPCAGVSYAIKKYRSLTANVNLNEFLRAIKYLRNITHPNVEEGE